jgi:holo-[acyl-carrier protein] synthase
MMPQIIGIGLDATDIPRISTAIQRYGDRFLHRVFTEGEIVYCLRRREPAPHFAGRFAVKEAAMKALGTGHAMGVLFRDIEVVRRGGPPQLQLHGGAAQRFAAIGGRTTVVTITHSDTLALAQVIVLGD